LYGIGHTILILSLLVPYKHIKKNRNATPLQQHTTSTEPDDDDKSNHSIMKNQTNNKSWMTIHSPSGFVQFDDESRDDLFISNTSDNIRSCYMLNLGFSLVDDFAFNANDRDISKIELNDDEDNNSDNGNGNENENENPLKVAIQTARIFNGIIVGKHGTLLKQNNRADPDKLGTIVKEGQSRQAVQIEQIIAATNKNDDYGYDDDNNNNNNNLDDDHCKNSNATAAAVDNDEEAVNDDHEPQLLIVRGQYEDLSHLIRNGSEILRKNKDDKNNKLSSSLSLVRSLLDQNDY
jgi:hypothetical protein